MTNFDSFSEDLIPRITPKPALGPTLDISRPIVPEVSLLFDEPKKTTANNDGPTLSYKEWREKQQNNGMKKKIVTFECPEQPETVSNLISFIPPQPQQSNFSFNQTMQADSNNIEEKSKRYQYNPLPNVNPIPQQQPTTLQYGLPQTNSNAFEQFTVDDMYKLLTLQKNMQETVNNEIEAITPQQMPEPMPTTKQKVELQDLFNLMLQIQQQSSQSQQNKNDERPTVPPKALETKDIVVRQNENISSQNDVEPTTRDLVNIIMRQQEQLTSLQNQVHTLVRSIASDSSASVNNINRTAPKPMSVMTSLEINVQKIHNKKSPLDRRIIDTQPPALHETRNPCRCQCQQMKSDPSSYPDDNFIQRKNSNELLNANMNAQFPQDSSNPPGFTLYGNILNQVNDVLQNSPPIDSTKIQQIRSDSQSSQTNDRNNYVASAQFKQFGIQFDDVNVAATSKRVTYDSTPTGPKHTPNQFQSVATTEKSMLMNTLAMKYLTNEQSPNQFRNDLTPNKPTATSPHIIDSNNAINCSPSDISMTSYKYMEKYGLL